MYTHITIDATHKVTDHYNLLEKLGVGKFGQVFKLTHKETGRVCAGKFYKGRRAKEREAARKEIELMNYLHHPKLVQCLAAYDNKPEMVMVMEFIAGGELFERIVDDNFEHTEPASVRYMQQILEGIAYMHQQNIIHLDLKPENIVCVDHTGTSIKVIDFGLASRLDPNTPLKVMHGTPEFVAPEVISYEPVCLATDMWSIGVICYILLSGESPFQGNSDDETLALVTAAQWEFDEDSFEEITEQAKDFISSLLNKNTRRRMTCEEALAHPWMAAFDSGDPSTTKSLSKEKMKRFLARQKWKVTPHVSWPRDPEPASPVTSQVHMRLIKSCPVMLFHNQIIFV
uniref:Myosin, light chain kinase 5 n=1 Tax=Myripristis murdjan TaxID=586833 RepID=A0A667X146_9TELE